MSLDALKAESFARKNNDPCFILTCWRVNSCILKSVRDNVDLFVMPWQYSNVFFVYKVCDSNHTFSWLLNQAKLRAKKCWHENNLN